MQRGYKCRSEIEVSFKIGLWVQIKNYHGVFLLGIT